MSAAPMVVAAARVLSQRNAEQCGIDADDMWKQYGEDFIADAQAALDAAGGPELLAALRIAREFMSIASDWNLDEAEINGEMRSTYDWLADVDAAIAKATGSAA